MDYLIVSDVEDAVATITLNRPDKRNALSIALRDEVSDTLDRLAGDAAVKTVVITGAGDVFCAGFDLSEFAGLDDPAFAKRLWDSSDRFHKTCLEFPLPLVAAVNGPALAGGFDLAVMADIRLADETARFAHPELEFSEVVYGPLQELIGGARARDIAFTGRTVSADEARAIGLVSSVVRPGGLDAAVASVTAQIAKAPREVLLKMKAKAVKRAGVATGATLDL